MRTAMRADLKAAIKARDRVAVAALRSALAAIDNAEAVALPSDGTPLPATENATADDQVAGASTGLGSAEVERRQLTDADLRSIVEKERQDRTAAAADYERLGHDELAEKLRSEAVVLDRYLG